jgi:ABC-type phosphate/phosphonate transport system permease subunit
MSRGLAASITPCLCVIVRILILAFREINCILILLVLLVAFGLPDEQDILASLPL